MTTGTVKPNGDKTTEWAYIAAYGETYQYECVDEYPSSPDSSYINADGLIGDGLSEIFYMSTLTGVGTVTAITVYTYGSNSHGNNDPSIDISFDNGSSWQGAQTCNIDTTPAEVTNTWSSLSKTQSQLDNLLVKYISDSDTKGYWNRVDRIYALVTYTLAGFSHSYIGVPGANIGSVDGVPVANIASINGVY